ncbi:hypothetical protein BT67DRAFT_256753 [Trichocladium antarcticum]|uniref:RING-CH-type domain-containing protein n=1 Tax=Trichocladium antarcticum TaxID=1450529 RepID=A0AAN6ZFK0_9PEZI|nr:hypothetical protein BT67DRAFT_256753 [Trichocladium antarcticum]
MATESFLPGWTFPPGMDAPNNAHRTETQTTQTTHTPPATDEQPHNAADASDAPPPAPTPTQQPRHYKPRTCRICLEVVNPTTDLDDSIAGRVFASKARVRYISEDPELGRLMSPCKCKGSQKYVHEGCLQAWRNAAPLSDRNYWRCPTCHFEYRMARLRWGRWLSSKMLRAALTVLVMAIAVFMLGFVADPIINFGLDPWGSIAGTIMGEDYEVLPLADEDAATWSFHFMKGFLSLGLLGFLKTMLAMSPWHWWNVRVGGRRRRGAGQDRMESINWFLVVIGVLAFLGATWKVVSHLSAKALEKASEHVVDVQEDNPDDDEENDGPEPETEPRESRKDK